jgi:hypothetical protein
MTSDIPDKSGSVSRDVFREVGGRFLVPLD